MGAFDVVSVVFLAFLVSSVLCVLLMWFYFLSFPLVSVLCISFVYKQPSTIITVDKCG